MDQHQFIYQALVFLTVAVIFVPIAKKLGLGSVLGYLMAGVVIGPFLLGFVGHEGENIMHFAEFGVVLMLFLIGLELKPELLWKLRRSILGLGIMQLSLTTILVAALAVVFGFGWTDSIVLGMILSMSSTAIVLQTLTEKGLIKTSAGQSAFAVLLFQDIAVIPILAILPLFSKDITGNTRKIIQHLTWVDGEPGWMRGLIMLIAIGGITFLGRILIRPLLRIVAKAQMREIFTATSLLIVIAIAELMTQIGLSPALGAFLAGVVLANSEYRHELESDIEPFKGLLMGVFFMAVGASINFQLVANHIGSVISWVLLLIIIKSGVLFFLGRIIKLDTKQNFIFSFSLSQVGEFAFVLLSFSLQQAILSEDTVNLMIAVVAISMALTPIVMMLNEKLIVPHVGIEIKPLREPDVIDERNRIIIAGFGHFGSTVGRFLQANKINATYLDIDPDRVDLLRKMGFKVFYGDASRAELLESAGAKDARIIVIAIGSPEKRLEMVATIKKYFPNLHMLVRSENRFDAYDQMNAGLLHIYRETLDTSLRMGADAMTLLGYKKITARRRAKTFFKYDEQALKNLSTIRDQEVYINEIKKRTEELELIMQSDYRFSKKSELEPKEVVSEEAPTPIAD
ncbi:MAG: monovalent cation:proton antiporter-2 (CPA2) family protein [Ginsengibacter sp.]